MATPHVRNAFSKERCCAIEFTEPSQTKQSFKASCDINNIMVKYVKTGVFDHVRQYQGQYYDANPTDYHEAMNIVVNAQQMFDDLPAKARDYFRNDPANFLQFFEDNPEDGPELLYELGLSLGTRNGNDMHPLDARYEGQIKKEPKKDNPKDEA